MALNLKPLGSRVVVEPIEQEDITAGGIVLPETAKEKPQKGKFSPLVLATATKKANASPWMSRSAIWSCSPSMPAPKSRWTARNC